MVPCAASAGQTLSCCFSPDSGWHPRAERGTSPSVSHCDRAGARQTRGSPAISRPAFAEPDLARFITTFMTNVIRRGLPASGQGTPRLSERAQAVWPVPDGDEAPPCMRWRGLAGVASRWRADCSAAGALRDRPLVPETSAADRFPGPSRPLGSPPRWSPYEVVSDFLRLSWLPAQGVSVNRIKILWPSTVHLLSSPDLAVYPPHYPQLYAQFCAQAGGATAWLSFYASF